MVGFFEALEAIIHTIDMESKEHIIIGDLNCNYLSDRISTHLSQLQQLSSTYQFQQLIAAAVSEPEASECGSSLISVSQYIKGAKNLISFKRKAL